MSSLTSPPVIEQEQSKTPRYATIQLIRGGQLKKIKININHPGDRSLWVSSLVELPPGPRSTLRVLAVDFFNVERGDVFPSCSTIARHTGYKRQVIQRHLKRLKNEGLITAVGTSTRGTVVYKVNVAGFMYSLPQEKPTEKPEKIDTLDHWRVVYQSHTRESDLDGMPEDIAEILFEESRETESYLMEQAAGDLCFMEQKRVENSVKNGKRPATLSDTHLQLKVTPPATLSDTNRKDNRTSLIDNRISLKREQPKKPARLSTTTSKSNGTIPWERMSNGVGSQLGSSNGHTRRQKPMRPEDFLDEDKAMRLEDFIEV